MRATQAGTHKYDGTWHHHTVRRSRSDKFCNGSSDEREHGVRLCFIRDNKPKAIDSRSHRSNPADPERVDMKDVLTRLIVDYPVACPWSLVRMHPICPRQSQYRGSRSSPRRNKIFAASTRGTTAGDERYDYSNCPAARKVVTKDPQRLVSIP